MDPELAFIQANMSGVQANNLVCDPFCGTGLLTLQIRPTDFFYSSGGLLIAAAHFGAFVTGTEINYAIVRAVGRSSRAGEGDLRPKKHSLAANFAQYALVDRFLGVLNADASQAQLWRARRWLWHF